MKEIKTIAKAKNFSAADFGKLSNLKDYVLQLGPDMKIPGKVFGGQTLGATGGEFSFQMFQPGTETGFLHTHKTHEELYFFLSGKGEYVVDGQTFPVQEGSVVRVAPAGKRAVRNNGSEPLVMLCVQYRADTMTETDAQDADILQEPVKW
jgi:mannose-6-phosphate isomerase-like protein (cupin superfamily)